MLLFVAALALVVREASSACRNEGWTDVGGKCYGLTSTYGNATIRFVDVWRNALTLRLIGKYENPGVNPETHDMTVRACAKFNAVLPRLKTKEENYAFWNYSKHVIYQYHNLDNVYIGLQCNVNTNTPYWEDGTPMTYSNFWDAPNCTEDVFTFIVINARWSYGSFMTKFQLDVICEEVDVLPTNDYRCELAQGVDGYVASDFCVKAFNTSQNWPSALKQCRNERGTLPILRNSQINDFFVSFASNQGNDYDYYPIGLEYLESDWKWVDDHSIPSYKHFAPGYPVYEYGDCAYMDDSLGGWMNADCKSLQSPYLCQRLTTPKTPIPSTCSSKLLSVGDHFYSPGYPTKSNKVCDFILQAPAGKVVELQIVFFDGNAGDELILDDGTLGGTQIANVTGFQPKPLIFHSNKPQMWVHWSPKSGKAVGFHAIFQAKGPL